MVTKPHHQRLSGHAWWGWLRETGTESDGFVEITMEDSGVGIDPVAAERTFDPFSTSKASGTGLGLAIVERFAGGNDGTASIENGSGDGTGVAIRPPHATVEVTP